MYYRIYDISFQKYNLLDIFYISPLGYGLMFLCNIKYVISRERKSLMFHISPGTYPKIYFFPKWIDGLTSHSISYTAVYFLFINISIEKWFE